MVALLIGAVCVVWLIGRFISTIAAIIIGSVLAVLFLFKILQAIGKTEAGRKTGKALFNGFNNLTKKPLLLGLVIIAVPVAIVFIFVLIHELTLLL